MFELTELPFGNDSSRIKRNFPCSDLGTRSSGEQVKFSNGGFLNDPAMRFFSDSLANFSNTLTGLSVADLWFLHINDGASPNVPSLRPY